jgi:predicted O-methyltransferase YrrM
MTPRELRWLAEQAERIPAGGSLVEIGVYKGRSTCALAAHTAGTVYSVDIWSEAGTDGWYYDVFRQNTERYPNIVAVNRASVWAAREFAAQGKRFGFVFIDASHDQYNVRQDILAWRPLLADGGVFAGHDYSPSCGWPDVKMIVDELIPGVQNPVDAIWVAPKN